MSTSLAEALFSCLRQSLDVPLVTIGAGRAGQADQVLTGAWLLEAALTRAAALAGAFDPNDGPLAVAMPCGAEFVVTLFAALHAGFTVTAVAIPRPGTQVARFNNIVADCRPAAILCTAGGVPRLEQAREAAPTDRHCPIIDVAGLAAGDQRECYAVDPTRPAILQYTSGSTRMPRGVMLSSDNILANAALADARWGVRGETMFSWLPHFHDLGLMAILHPILSGGSTCLLDPLHMIQRPDRWLWGISDKRAKISGGPAFAFAHCLNSVRDEQCEGLDLSNWRIAFCGAEPVPSALMDAFRTRFARYGLASEAVFACYGLAESTLLVAGEPAAPAQQAAPPPPAGCDGIEPCHIPAELQDTLRIVDPVARSVVEDGIVGEVWLSGRSVARGYVDNPADTTETFDAALEDERGTWLRTGDLATLDHNRLYVTGRLKDVLFGHGGKASAAEVEWLAARQVPELNPLAAAAVMLDDRITGQALLLIEVRRRGISIDASAARTAIRRAVLGAHGIDFTNIRFFRAGSLPRTSSGKIQRRVAAAACLRDEIAGELP